MLDWGSRLHGRPLFGAILTTTALGFFLIGFDNGLMGGLVDGKGFNETFGNPGATIVGLIVANYDLGCFFGSCFCSIFGDRLGRRRLMDFGAILLAIGAILQGSAYHRAHIMVGRIVSGIGMGFVNSTVPVIQSEFSPKATRGFYVCVQLSCLNFGIFLVYWIDFGFSYVKSSAQWRVPVLLQLVFILPIFFLTRIIPESPRWLVNHDRPQEALAVLCRVQGKPESDSEIQKTYTDIIHAVEGERLYGTGKWSELIHNDGYQSSRRFLVAIAIQAFQQLGGINAVIYYSTTLFKKSLGFSDYKAGLMSGFLQTWFFVASFIPWLLIDRVGRRKLLLSQISFMAAVMAVFCALVYQVQYNTPISHASGIAGAVMLFLFQGSFTIGFQATVWVYPSEILPLRLRQKGSAVSTAANWICNYMVVLITPVAIKNIGYRTYIIFATLNASFVPIIYFFFWETKGLSLEEIDELCKSELESDESDIDDAATATDPEDGRSLSIRPTNNSGDYEERRESHDLTRPVTYHYSGSKDNVA